MRRWLWKENENSIPNADDFTHLYDETYLIVFRYLYGLSGGPLQEAEDLTAETYARAWKTRQNFKGNKQAALGWLLRIARNLAIDLSRRRKVRKIDENVPIELIIDPDLLPELDVISREQITVLWGMLDRLTDDVREMLVLRYLLGWQVKEIAAHLEMHENNVTVTIKRTLKNLQRDWAAPEEQDHE